MGKEIIICIVIIIAILIGNYVTQNYVTESIQELEPSLLALREKLKKGEEADNYKVKEEIENIFSQWDNRHEKLAYFIEHDELEKVETNLISLKSFIETKEYMESISELDKSVFLLKHIEDKYAFNLQNIF